ncbi:malonic semialdehyde reductase [Gemmobacter serpentinus]|uniref:malonic semialdehyde reductase n=1 Tax=Gemmobacter serpentinus TaxID=2652247 RepID=UPI00124DAF16|nr:malonic semialdehyde reductase [Gemmobacter serpentinus]
MADEAVMTEIAAAKAAMAVMPDAGLDLMFRAAHTHNGFLDRPVSDALLMQILDLAKMAPTANNSQPLRVSFIRSAEAKAQLGPLLAAGNRDKTLAAPATAILWADAQFWQHYPRLAPHMKDPTGGFADNLDGARAWARMNATLQAGYFILAARALGLDCGPMGGFDKAGAARVFAPDGMREALMLVNLGYGDPEKVRPRAGRLAAQEMAQIL